MLEGKPTIAKVLPAFHAFAQDTVLVAHNAAFDMRFLQLKEAATGIVFDQPVLDTLLLSAVVHPNQESHRLEEIAARFDVTVLGRHTALQYQWDNDNPDVQTGDHGVDLKLRWEWIDR